MRKHRLFTITFRMILIGLIVLETSGYAFSDGKRIGVSLLTREHQFFRELEEGLMMETRKSNLKVTVVYAEFDSTRQASQIEDFINKRVDALVLAPADSIAIGDSIVKANEAGIPVFTVDITNLSGKGKVVTHIASDNVAGGREAAQMMVEALKGKGRIVIINHPKVTSVMDRVASFREYLRNYKNIQIIADIPAWGQRDRAMSIMEDLLLMMPDLNGVFAINDDSALGAARAIEAAGLTGKIAIIGYDASPEARKAIENGKIYGDVVQNPREIGRLTVKSMADYFDGKSVRPFIPVRVGRFDAKLAGNSR